MEQKQIVVGSKTFNIRELKAIELDDIDFSDKKNGLKKQILLSTGLSEDEYNNLSVKERHRIITTMNDINGLNENF